MVPQVVPVVVPQVVPQVVPPYWLDGAGAVTVV